MDRTKPGVGRRDARLDKVQPAKGYARSLVSGPEGAGVIDRAPGPSSDPLAAFNHIRDTLA